MKAKIFLSTLQTSLEYPQTLLFTDKLEILNFLNLSGFEQQLHITQRHFH